MKKFFLYLSVFVATLLYGFIIGKYEIFPFSFFNNIKKNIFTEIKPEYKYRITKKLDYSTVDLSKINVEDLISVTPSNIDSFRNTLIQKVFGTPSLSKSLPDSIYFIEVKDWADMENLKSIEKFHINQQYEINSIGYIFHPEKSNNKLCIYHQGHRGDFFMGKKTISSFLKKGFTVYAFSMPLLGKNQKHFINKEKIGIIPMDNHQKFYFFETPLKYFANPIIVMINHAKTQNIFSDIIMVGISGGGWTTTLVAAIDNRIDLSFPVAGSYPMFIRFYGGKAYSSSDIEQLLPGLIPEINYLDLYILGAVGEKRKQVQMLNKNDACCFNGEYSNYYTTTVKEYVSDFQSGSFDLLLDNENKEHSISFRMIEEMFSVIESR